MSKRSTLLLCAFSINVFIDLAVFNYNTTQITFTVVVGDSEGQLYASGATDRGRGQTLPEAEK